MSQIHSQLLTILTLHLNHSLAATVIQESQSITNQLLSITSYFTWKRNIHPFTWSSHDNMHSK